MGTAGWAVFWSSLPLPALGTALTPQQPGSPTLGYQLSAEGTFKPSGNPEFPLPILTHGYCCIIHNQPQSRAGAPCAPSRLLEAASQHGAHPWGSVPILCSSTPPKRPSWRLAQSFQLAEPATLCGCAGSCPPLLHLKSPIISRWGRKGTWKAAKGPAGLVHTFLRHILQEGGAPAWPCLMRAGGLEPAELPIMPAAAPWVCGRAAEKEERRR